MSERYFEREPQIPDFEKDPGRRIERDLTNVEPEPEWEVLCLSKQFKNRKCPTKCPFYELAKAKVMADNGRADLKEVVQREIEARFNPDRCINQQTIAPVR